jgi:hypothetical protein
MVQVPLKSKITSARSSMDAGAELHYSVFGLYPASSLLGKHAGNFAYV